MSGKHTSTIAKNQIELCENCRYYDVEYEWDDDFDDEIEIEICKKGHNIEFETICACSDFKK